MPHNALAFSTEIFFFFFLPLVALVTLWRKGRDLNPNEA